MKIQVTNQAYYPGQDMGWTEKITDEIVAEGEAKYFHFSDDEIKEFRAKQTCFFDAVKNHNDEIKPEFKHKKREYLYAYTPKEGKYGEEYCNEVRFDLEEGEELELIGYVDMYWKGMDYEKRNAYKTTFLN